MLATVDPVAYWMALAEAAILSKSQLVGIGLRLMLTQQCRVRCGRFCPFDRVGHLGEGNDTGCVRERTEVPLQCSGPAPE